MSTAKAIVLIKIKNHNYKKITLLAMTLLWLSLCSIAWYLVVTQFEVFQLKARQKEGLTLLNSAYVAMKATESEQVHFVFDEMANRSGFNPNGKLHYTVHFSEITLTNDDLRLTPKTLLPYVTKNRFRILAIGKNITDGKHDLCSVDNEKKITCILIDSKMTP
ncbi:MAG: hypothetical protein IT287_01795 [Bdellovibrionaceae bacterium]|nr:hypothetical protein [Pseudobdellovibrionaceae bacterium]